MNTVKTAYLTVAEADIYFQGKLNTDAWDNASAMDRQKALIEASTQLDKIQYVGHKINPQSEHEFPREFQDPAIDESRYDTDNIPFEIKYAVCEQALALLDGFNVNDEVDGLSIVGQAYSSVKADFDSAVPMHLKCGLCAEAWQFILPFIRDNRSLVMARVN